MAEFKKMYDNPLINAAFTFVEPFPIGLVVTLDLGGGAEEEEAGRPERAAVECAAEAQMLKDLRHAIRMLAHAKGWTAVVVLSLGLGIGANAALFSAVNGMLLTKIPVRDPDTLVRLRWSGKNDMVTSSSDYGFVAKGAGRPERPDHLLVSDVPAVRRRQSRR